MLLISSFLYFCSQNIKFMTTLYLVRHGETVDNVAQILQGQTQGQLNEKGIEQAKEVCEKMKDCDIDVFLSSDLKRVCIPADTRSPIPVIPVHSVGNLQYMWQS